MNNQLSMGSIFQGENMNVRSITEGGLICAIAVILALLCYYVPFMILLYIFIPVPIVVLTKRRGLRPAVIASIAASVLLFCFIDAMSALTYALYLVLVGCTIGWCYYKEKDGFIRLGVGYIAIFISLVISIVVLQKVSGTSLISDLSKEIDTGVQNAINLYQSQGLLSGDQLNTVTSQMNQLVENIKLMIPSAFLIMPFFVSWVNIILSDKILKRTGHSVKPLRPLSHWILPRSLKNFLMIVILFLLAAQIFQFEAIPQIYISTFDALTNFIFGLMGLSFIFWLIFRKRPKQTIGPKILTIVILMFIPFSSMILTLAGVVDVYTGIRYVIILRDEEKRKK